MAVSKPLESFLGGLGIPIPAHVLLLLNGNVFGVSGFMHHTIKGNKEAIAGVTGLVLGGIFIGFLERANPLSMQGNLFWAIASGILIGIGSKMGNGCTSGHMICGLSRFSLRSITATICFFVTGAISAHLFNRRFPMSEGAVWILSPASKKLLLYQAPPTLVSALLYTANCSEDAKYHPTLRLLALITTGFQFALALCVSDLTDPARVISFLLTPLHRAFDPSLLYLAAGAIPTAAFCYHYLRGNEIPKLGGDWQVPTNKSVDARLLTGASLFGLGWGMLGICPGPGLVNVGRIIGGGGSGLGFITTWLAAVAVGGLLP